MPQNNNPQNFNVDAFAEKLDALNNHFLKILYVLERSGKTRVGSPTSVYIPYQRSSSKRRYNTKSFEELTKRELNQFIGAPFKKLFADFDKQKKAFKKTLNDPRSTTLQIQDAKRGLADLRKLQRETRKEQNERRKNAKEIYEENDEFSQKSIDERWDEMSDAERKRFKNKKKRYVKHEKKRQKYNRKQKAVRDASNALAESDLGGTKFGRTASSLLGKYSDYNSLKFLGSRLSNGGAKDISTSMLGNGATAKTAQGSIESVGNAASSFAGPMFVLSLIVSGIMAPLKMWGKVVSAVAQYKTELTEADIELVNAQADFQMETLQASGNLQSQMIGFQTQMMLKEMQVAAENSLGAFKVMVDQYAKAHEIAAGYIFKGIQESVWDALSSAVSAAGDIRKYGIAKEQRGISLGATKRAVGAQKHAAQVGYETTVSTATANYEGRVARAKDMIMIANETHYIGKAAANEDLTNPRVMRQGEQATRAIHNRTAPNLGAADKFSNTQQGIDIAEAIALDQAGALKEVQEARTAINKFATTENYRSTALASKKLALNAKLHAEAEGINQQIVEQGAQISAQRKEAIVDAAVKVKQAWVEYAKNVEQYIYETDAKTNDLGINAGFTTQKSLRDYKLSMYSTLRDVARKWGQDLDSFVTAQNIYFEQTARNKVMGKDDYNAIMAGNLIAGDDVATSRFASAMEIFNTSIKDASQILFNNSNDVNRSGLNARKYIKNATDSLKLAQKYNFKGGVDGLLRMVKWATNMRFNMADVSGILDTVREGGLEGVITQASKLHVLGGNISMYADFMGMYHDAWAEGDSYAKRVADMTRGYGTINRKSGETTFNINEQWVLTQMAKAINMPAEDLFNIIRARNRDEFIRLFLKDKPYAQQWDETTMENIVNTAAYNNKTEEWEIMVRTKTKDKDGNVVDVFHKKKLSEFDENTDEIIMPSTYEENVEKHLEEIVTSLNKLYGEEIGEKADMALLTYNTALIEAKKRSEKAMSEYWENRDKYIQAVINGMSDATNAWRGYFSEWLQGNKEIDAECDKIAEKAKNLNSEVNKVAVEAKNLKGRLADIVDAKVAYVKAWINTLMDFSIEPKVIRLVDADNGDLLSTESGGGGIIWQQDRKQYEGPYVQYQYFDVNNNGWQDFISRDGSRSIGAYQWALGAYMNKNARFGDKNYPPKKVTETESEKAKAEAETLPKLEKIWEDYNESFNNNTLYKAQDALTNIDQSSPFNILFNEIRPKIKDIYNELPNAFSDKREILNDLIENVDTTTLKIGGDLKFRTRDGKYIDVMNFLRKDQTAMEKFKKTVINAMS